MLAKDFLQAAFKQGSDPTYTAIPQLQSKEASCGCLVSQCRWANHCLWEGAAPPCCNSGLADVRQHSEGTA